MADGDVPPASEKARELVTVELQRYLVYHDQKETMAYAAFALYVGAFGAGLVSTAWPPLDWSPSWLPAATIVGGWFGVLWFMGWQLRRRRLASIRVAGAERLLARWVRTPPAPNDLDLWGASTAEADPQRTRGRNLTALLGLLLLPPVAPLPKADVDDKEHLRALVVAWNDQTQDRRTAAVLHEWLLVAFGYALGILVFMKTLHPPHAAAGAKADLATAPFLATGLAPAWVQAAAAVLSCVATLVLAVLTARYVRLTRTIAESAQQQVDHALSAGLRHAHAVAATLLIEARRIRQELGEPLQPHEVLASVANAVRGNALIPEVHSWVRPVIPEVAEADPTIVGLFLDLERDLHNYRGGLKELRDAQTVHQEQCDSLARWHRSHPGTVGMGLVVERQGVENQIELAKLKLEGATQFATNIYKACHEDLDRLEPALRQLLA